MRQSRLAMVLLSSLVAASCGDSDSSTTELPEACPTPQVRQSPAVFGASGIEPEVAETCDTEGTNWTICQQHMHCDPEHSGAGICGSADCEVHTVYRRQTNGAAAPTIAAGTLHEGTVGSQCLTSDGNTYDLLVHSTFLSFDNNCQAGNDSKRTYCGSATGKTSQDINPTDGVVSCAESGVNTTSVRWCIETACECHAGSTPEAQSEEYGENEPHRVQGCPNS